MEQHGWFSKTLIQYIQNLNRNIYPLPMILQYSYRWYIRQFDQAKETAENFLLAVDEAYFLKPPAENSWCIAEIYHHLIKFGNIYYRNLASQLPEDKTRVDNTDTAFPPRWIWQKVADFFEPPYAIRINTFSSMEPDITDGYNRFELLDKFMNLQDQFIDQIEYARNARIDLSGTRIPHPIVDFLKLTFSEYYQLNLAHQRRHQWQAEQTLSALREQYEKADPI